MKCSFKNLFVLGMLIIQRVGLKTPTVLVFLQVLKAMLRFLFMFHLFLIPFVLLFKWKSFILSIWTNKML